MSPHSHNKEKQSLKIVLRHLFGDPFNIIPFLTFNEIFEANIERVQDTGVVSL